MCMIGRDLCVRVCACVCVCVCVCVCACARAHVRVREKENVRMRPVSAPSAVLFAPQAAPFILVGSGELRLCRQTHTSESVHVFLFLPPRFSFCLSLSHPLSSTNSPSANGVQSHPHSLTLTCVLSLAFALALLHR